jgi:hypothetical protein
MTDVVQNAMNYRQQLLADISRVDEFLQTGAYLLRLNRGASDGIGSSKAPEVAAEPETSAPAKADTPARADSPMKAAEATPAPSSAAAEPAIAALTDSPPRRKLSFRGAFDDSESEPRRNIA